MLLAKNRIKNIHSLQLFVLSAFVGLVSCKTNSNLFEKRKYLKLRQSKELVLSEIKTIHLFQTTETTTPDLSEFKVSEKCMISIEEIADTNVLENKVIILSDLPTVYDFRQETKNRNRPKAFFIRKQLAQRPASHKPQKGSNTPTKEYSLLLLVILCFFLPFLAVGLKTNWDMIKVLITLLLMLAWPFAVVYALLVIYNII